MRTRLLLAAAAFVTLSASAAPQGLGGQAADAVGAQPKASGMAPFLFDGVQGQYALADGRILTVTGKVDGQGRKLYADLGDGATEIIHVGKNRFVGLDKDVRLSFARPNLRRPVESVRVSDLAGRQSTLAQR